MLQSYVLCRQRRGAKHSHALVERILWGLEPLLPQKLLELRQSQSRILGLQSWECGFLEGCVSRLETLLGVPIHFGFGVTGGPRRID